MATNSGTWDIKPGALITLQTEKIGMTSLEVTAPVTGGRLHVVTHSVEIMLELSLEKLKASNFLMQGAARALVKKFNGDQLLFDAKGSASAQPWEVSGNAKAGQVDVPMTVSATPQPTEHPAQLLLGGTVTMNDISIPIPGLGGINSVTFTIDGTVDLTRA